MAAGGREFIVAARTGGMTEYDSTTHPESNPAIDAPPIE